MGTKLSRVTPESICTRIVLGPKKLFSRCPRPNIVLARLAWLGIIVVGV